MTYLRGRPALVAFAILLAFLGIGLIVIRDVANEAQRRTCISSIEERVVIREILGYARSRNPSPAAVEFFEFFDRRLTLPPAVCKGTGVDVADELAKVAKARPALPEPSTTSTSATAPPAAGTPGPPGPAGRPGRDLRPTPTSTATTAPPPSSSTTSTTSRRPILPTLPLAARSSVAPGPGDDWHAAGISAFAAAVLVGLVAAAASRRYPRG